MDENQYSYQFYGTTQAAWDSMYSAILAAKKSIYWEVFIFIDDAIGTKFMQALSDKAKAGVEVKLIFDSVGSYSFSRAAEHYFSKANVEVLWFNRLFPTLKLTNWFVKLFNRNHRKVLIIDEEIYFLGGVNISMAYHSWDDIYLKITGTVGRPLLRGFAKSYISSGGKKINIQHLLKRRRIPIPWSIWKERLQFIIHSPRYTQTTVAKKAYLKIIDMAKESVNLITPYFVPDKQFLKAIALARGRGVKVNIYLPLRSDYRIAEVVARAYYGLAAKAGANLYFMEKMNHAKAVSADGKVGLIGSINVTPGSFYNNEESGVVFNDIKMVEDLNNLFNYWAKEAKPFDEVKWRMRGLKAKIKEWLAKWLEKYF